MKYDLSKYPDFWEAVTRDELVYLFGSGISGALSNARCGWKNWILDGIGYLEDKALAERLEEKIEQDSSARSLIDIAGTVIKITKDENHYAEWMHAFIETPSVQNRSLADTLKKLLVTQDVFVTTNYDRLLEQATGLGTISYDRPDLAFSMLDQHRSTAVLHIHGVYDSKNNVDSIVADQEQYDRVLDDKGAQFIQNILGTRTLILICCGGTADDVNIAQFLQFAKTHLKMDRTYYFLYREDGMPLTDMPKNIQCIPYGTEYSDLQPFLEDMAQARIRARIENEPLILRTAYTEKCADAYGLAEYHFSNEYLKFCGRKVELARLENFAETDAPFSWWAVTGQAGAGKSRLSYELLHRLERSYFAFFLDTSVDVGRVGEFKPFTDTFIIIDYIKGNEGRTAQFIAKLLDLFEPTSYKLRLLLLERDNQLLTGSWYQLLEESLDTGHRMRFLNGEYNTDISSRDHRFLYLDDLDEEAVVELIGDICAKKRLPEDTYRDVQLKNEYGKKFEQLKFRPLFLQLYVEAWIDNGCIQVDYRNYEELLRSVLTKEQERILNAVGGDVAACTSLIRLLIRACISDTLSLDALPELYRQDWQNVKQYNKQHSLPGMQRKERLITLVTDAEQSLKIEEAVLEPMYPDIIKEAMFLYYADEDELDEIGEELWANCPQSFMTFLSRVLIDFADNEMLREYVRRVTADYSNTYAMQARYAVLQNEVVRTVEEGPMLVHLAKDEYAYWHNMPLDETTPEEIQLIKLKGLNLSAIKYLGWTLPESLEILEEIAKFNDNPLTTPYKISALLEHVHYFTEQSVGETSEKVIDRILPMVEALPDSGEKKLYWLNLQREHIVNLICAGKVDEAWSVYESVFDALDKTDEQMMELYAYIVFSAAKTSLANQYLHDLLNYSAELQDMAVAYGEQQEQIAFNDKIHYYYLHAKLLSVQMVALGSTLSDFGQYGVYQLDSLIDEIESNMMIADFSGLLVGVKALKIRFDDSVTDEQVQVYFEEADVLLERYPDNEVLAEKVLDMWETAHSSQYKTAVPKHLVKRAYALYLRFPGTPEVQDRFHGLLLNSTEISNWRNYYNNRQICAKLIQNHRADYMIPPEPQAQTHRRPYRKVGANDPCPCGSGKKFKKCCRGKGIYD